MENIEVKVKNGTEIGTLIGVKFGREKPFLVAFGSGKERWYSSAEIEEYPKKTVSVGSRVTVDSDLEIGIITEIRVGDPTKTFFVEFTDKSGKIIKERGRWFSPEQLSVR